MNRSEAAVYASWFAGGAAAVCGLVWLLARVPMAAGVAICCVLGWIGFYILLRNVGYPECVQGSSEITNASIEASKAANNPGDDEE